MQKIGAFWPFLRCFEVRLNAGAPYSLGGSTNHDHNGDNKTTKQKLPKRKTGPHLLHRADAHPLAHAARRRLGDAPRPLEPARARHRRRADRPALVALVRFAGGGAAAAVVVDAVLLSLCWGWVCVACKQAHSSLHTTATPRIHTLKKRIQNPIYKQPSPHNKTPLNTIKKGTTTSSAAAAARSSTRGGRPRPAAR